MSHETALSSGGIVHWIRLTWGGWLLGIPCIIALALLGELFGVGGAQFLVGAGMGAGVGLMQAYVIRRLTGKTLRWVLSSMIGLALPFIVTDLAKVIGIGLPYILEANVAIGGLLAGIAQWLLLRDIFSKAWTWIVASTVGWGLAGATSAVAEGLGKSQSILGLAGALAYLGIVAGGGLILGVITSISLRVMTSENKQRN